MTALIGLLAVALPAACLLGLCLILVLLRRIDDEPEPPAPPPPPPSVPPGRVLWRLGDWTLEARSLQVVSGGVIVCRILCSPNRRRAWLQEPRRGTLERKYRGPELN